MKRVYESRGFVAFIQNSGGFTVVSVWTNGDGRCINEFSIEDAAPLGCGTAMSAFEKEQAQEIATGIVEKIRRVGIKRIPAVAKAEFAHSDSSHQNQVGGWCNREHGNTCGFHPEHDRR